MPKFQVDESHAVNPALGPGKWAVLQLPQPFTQTDWDLMLRVLHAMKPGLIMEPTTPPKAAREKLARSRLAGVLTQEDQSALFEAIRTLHGGEPRFIESVPVHEEFEGLTVWKGVVHVFDLEGHPTASRVYAWSEPAQRAGRRKRFFAVLHQGAIDSAVAALRASIIEDYGQHGGQRG